MTPPRVVDGKLRFTWVTDTHTTGAALPQNVALTAAVEDCNTWLPDLFINTGDVGNDTLATVQKSFAIMNACQRPVHVAIGNHDEWEEPPGTPQTSQIEGADCFNRPAPFYYSVAYGNALLLFLDCNFFGDTPDEYHDVGDRVGHYAGVQPGGDLRQLGTTQLQWLSDTMAASDADYILVFLHYPVVGLKTSERTDFPAALAVDGRVTAVFYGHNHGHAIKQTHAGIPFYKCPALLESGCWTRVVVSEQGRVESMIIHNFTNPGSWEINEPFKLRVLSAPLAIAV